MTQRLYQLNVHRHFDAAHYLPDHPGKCKNLHGHRWEVEVEIVATFSKAELIENGGMVRDFGDIKRIIDKYDHSTLNNYPMLENPTAEWIATAIHDQICLRLELFEHMVQVTVWESPECSVTVGGYDARP